MEGIRYTLKHIGINNPDEESARELCADLCRAFNLEIKGETPGSFFVGTLFEVMKLQANGAKGHIGIQTDDLEAAMEELKQKGIGVIEKTKRFDRDGKCTFVYLDREFAGFAIHLTI